MRAGRTAATLVSLTLVVVGGTACGAPDATEPDARSLPTISASPKAPEGANRAHSDGTGTGGGGGHGATTVEPGDTPPASSPLASSRASSLLVSSPRGSSPLAFSTVCWTSELIGSVLGSEGAAGTVYTDLALVNSGSTACTVRGFPGVSFVDAGRQLGAAADRRGPAGPSVSLAPGERAVATLAVTQPGVLPGCDAGQTAPAATVLIYPPDNRDPLRVRLTNSPPACTDPDVHQLAITTLEVAPPPS